jgi:hypothetical protein
MALSSRVQWMQQQQQWWARVWCHVWEWSQLGMHQTPKRIVEMLALIRVLAQLNFLALATSMVVAACMHAYIYGCSKSIIKPAPAVTYSCSGSWTMTICSNTFQWIWSRHSWSGRQYHECTSIRSKHEYDQSIAQLPVICVFSLFLKVKLHNFSHKGKESSKSSLC